MLRMYLFEAAGVLLTRVPKWSGLKAWGATAKAVFANAIKDNIEPAREDAREVFTLIVNRRGTECADERRVRAERGAP